MEHKIIYPNWYHSAVCPISQYYHLSWLSIISYQLVTFEQESICTLRLAIQERKVTALSLSLKLSPERFVYPSSTICMVLQ